MRWRVTFASPLLLISLLATGMNAQETQTVPVTITFPALNHVISGVSFPGLADTVYVPKPGTRIQYRVKNRLPADSAADRYTFEIKYFVGGDFDPATHRGAEFGGTLSVAAASTCEGAKGEGDLVRIACSVVERGNGITCEGIYSQMGDPPWECTGTQACIKCGDIRVCGADPVCP